MFRLSPAGLVQLTPAVRFGQDSQGLRAKPGELRAGVGGESGTVAVGVDADSGRHNPSGHWGGHGPGARHRTGRSRSPRPRRRWPAYRPLPDRSGPQRPDVSPLRYDDALTDQVSVFGEQDDGREDADQLQDADVAEILLGELVSGCRHGQPIHVYGVQQRHVLLPAAPRQRDRRRRPRA